MIFFTINNDFDRPAQKGHGAKLPGSEMARERKGQGAKGPRSELARKWIGQSPTGRFAPGSELARERKGSVPPAPTFCGSSVQQYKYDDAQIARCKELFALQEAANN